jgi:hypothetical protein
VVNRSEIGFCKSPAKELKKKKNEERKAPFLLFFGSSTSSYVLIKDRDFHFFLSNHKTSGNMFLKNGTQIENERKASEVFMGVGGKKEWISNKLYNPFCNF